jgi:hypothetical protein
VVMGNRDYGWMHPSFTGLLCRIKWSWRTGEREAAP